METRKVKAASGSFIIEIHLHVFNDQAVKDGPVKKGWKAPVIKICSHRLYCYCFKTSLDAREDNINGLLHWVGIAMGLIC